MLNKNTLGVKYEDNKKQCCKYTGWFSNSYVYIKSMCGCTLPPCFRFDTNTDNLMLFPIHTFQSTNTMKTTHICC